MRVEVTAKSAYSFLQQVDDQYPWSLVTEQSSSGTIMRFAMLVDGTASNHTVNLIENGTWFLTTEIEP